MFWYVTLVKTHPLITAMIQFAVLGTLGEVISRWVGQKRFYLPFTPVLILWKMVTWAILAVGIKYAFTGMDGFISELVNHSPHPLLPAWCAEKGTWGYAFVKSAMTNLQFGLLLVILHRVLDNMAETVKNWRNMDKSMLSLIWFWIPAHTVTFVLPPDFQIGLAALWSVALGVILGWFNRR